MTSRARNTLGSAVIAALAGSAIAGAQLAQSGRATRPPVVTQQPPIAAQNTRVAGNITWDFETGNLSGWAATGDAFVNQPTYGDNPTFRGSPSANPQGKYWIGTFEFYTGNRGKPGAAQGDKPTGTLTSTTFNMQGLLTFLIGGGSSKDTRVELLAHDPIDGVFVPVQSASGRNSDAMFDVTWNLSSYGARQGRVRIIDDSSGPWGHINVDDFRFRAGVRGTDVYTPPGGIRVTPPPPQPQPAIVPDLYGLTEPQARRLLDEARLTVGQVDRVENNSRPDRVFKQDLAPGSQVAPGTKVGFVLAMPPRPIPTYDPQPPRPTTVPSLAGLTEQEATKTLLSWRLAVGQVDRVESNAAANRVFKQDLAPGTQVAPGTKVGFVIAVPPRPIPTFTPQPPSTPVAFVPDLNGLREEEAMKSLATAGLAVGAVSRSESSAPADRVFKQDHAPGSQVSPGTKVGFVIAEPITAVVPNLVGMRDAGVARATLERVGLKAGKVDGQPSRARRDEVVSQAIGAGSKVVRGMAVDFIVATPILVNVPEVVKMSRNDAATILKRAELVDHVTPEESREPNGTVLRQDPAAGTVVELGSTVNLFVATPITVLVPQLVGLTAEAAVAELKKLELTPASRPQETRDAKPGIVIAQSVPAGRRAEIRTTVGVVVARLVTVDVPRLIDRSREDAFAAIQKAELKAVDAGSDESRKPQGTVISQDPAPGTKLDIGSPVSIVTARPVTVLVPDLASKPEAEARQLLAAAELVAGQVTAVEDRKPPGTVLQQSVAAGTRVTIGTSVSLVIATPVTVLVPPLLGRAETAARQALEKLELVVGTIKYEESPAATGTVQAQSIAAGTITPIGTAVDLVVAVVETTPMPRVIGFTFDAARQALLASRLVAGPERLRESKTDPRGIVVEQPFAPDARVPVGTAIVLTVATPVIVAVPRLDGRTHDEAIAEIRRADLSPGNVSYAISWRWRPGGTVIDQDRRPGERVEFGSTVSVTEAYSRALLGVPTALLALAGLAGLLRRKPATAPAPHEPPRPSAPPEGSVSDDPAELPAFDISAEPHLDPGESTVQSSERQAIRSEIRLTPVLDAGTQAVEAPGDIVTGERRVTNGGGRPPEASS